MEQKSISLKYLITVLSKNLKVVFAGLCKVSKGV